MPPTEKESSAQRHSRVRRQHTTELAQDYAEAIYRRTAATGQARVTDLARDFGVSHVSVIRALQRMEEQGWVRYAGMKAPSLTPSGEIMAQASLTRHNLLVRFFVALGVSAEQADADAEGAEHHLSQETMDAIRRFLKP